jgi:hypothetical protein
VNYLITYENSIFVAKQEPSAIQRQIQMIELQKPMLSVLYTNAANIAYCQQVMNVLENDFVQGFAKTENYKQSLRNELSRVPVNTFYATWVASSILTHLWLSLRNACPFDALPHCNIPLSLGRDALIEEVSKAANNSVVTIIGQILSLAFKITDTNNVGQMFWFYNTIIAQIGQNPQYENERNLLNWAKGQRAYAWIAIANTVIAGVANVSHIISEATAQRDIEEYGQQPLTLV